MSIEGLDFVGPIVGVRLVPCEDEVRVPDSALKNVVYLGHGDSAETFHAVGTGFVVDDQRVPGGVDYLVTAHHVVKLLKRKTSFAIRFNDKEGKSHIQQSSSRFSWWYHPDDKSVDAAVFPWS